MCIGGGVAAAAKPQLYNSFSQFQYEIVCESLIAFYNEFLSSTWFFPCLRHVVVVVAVFFCLLLVFFGAHNVTHWQFSVVLHFNWMVIYLFSHKFQFLTLTHCWFSLVQAFPQPVRQQNDKLFKIYLYRFCMIALAIKTYFTLPSHNTHCNIKSIYIHFFLSQCNLLNHQKCEVQNEMMERDKPEPNKNEGSKVEPLRRRKKSCVSNHLPIYDDWFVNSGCLERPMILSTVKVKKKKSS